LPDIDQSGNAVGSGCGNNSFVTNGSTVIRTSCRVIVDGSP
jgi:hypothetical protein